MGNAARLSEFFTKLKDIDTLQGARLSRIEVVGFASPEGPYELNQRLARQRAANLAKYLTTHSSIPDSLIVIHDRGIDWGGLTKVVSESEMSYKDEVLAMIDSVPEITYAPGTKRIVGSRKQKLMKIDGGRPWRWMLNKYYPYLRTAASIVCYIYHELPPELEVMEVEHEAADTVAEVVPEPVAEEPAIEPEPQEIEIVKYPIFAVRSNLLLPLLNVGVEVPVSKHWSVGADYYYPWIWPSKSNKNCYELIFVSAEARYWFNASRNQPLPDKNYLVGHSVAAYGAWGYYDFEHNYHGHQGQVWSAGLDYVYALPIAKGKLRMEFQIAVGAIWSPDAQPYKVYERGGHLIRERGHLKNFFYVGPTKVGVSLVLPINRKIKRTPSAAL